MRRALLVLTFLVAMAAIAAAILWRRAGVEAERLVSRAAELDPGARRSEWERALSSRRVELAIDRERLSALLPLFSGGGAGADAGPVLNALLEWPQPWPDRSRPPLRLPPEVIERLAGWGEGDVRRIAGIDLDGIDLRWMSQLSQFDHWDLDHHSPRETGAALGDRGDWFRDDEPRLEALTPWVKLRLMKGLLEGEPWESLAETRQLVRLLLSTQTLLGSVEAMVLLQLERQAYVASLGSHPDQVARWPAVGDAETPRAAIRYWRALPALLSLASLPADYDEAVRAPPPGMCAALREAVQGAVALRPLLDEAHADGYRRLEATLASAGECRLPHLRAALQPPSLAARWHAFGRIGEDARPLSDDAPDAPAVRRLAYLRSAPLRAATGEPLLLDAVIAALVTSR